MTDKNTRDYFNSLPTKNSPAGEDMAMFLDSENSSGGFPLLKKVINFDGITIDASVNEYREGCLWEDAPSTDESNFYSAKKIHDLIV